MQDLVTNISSFPSNRTPPPVPRPRHAPSDPEPTNVVGIFGLSVRTTEQDIEEKFREVANVDKVVIVYDARVRMIYLKLVYVEGKTHI